MNEEQNSAAIKNDADEAARLSNKAQVAFNQDDLETYDRINAEVIALDAKIEAAAMIQFETTDTEARALNSRDWDDEPHIRDAWDGEGIMIFPMDKRGALAIELATIAATYRENGEGDSFEFEALRLGVLVAKAKS